MQDRETYTSPCAYINFPAAVEMTMYNGRMKKHGDELVGLETGDPTTFKTWDEFWNAYLGNNTSISSSMRSSSNTSSSTCGRATLPGRWAQR